MTLAEMWDDVPDHPPDDRADLSATEQGGLLLRERGSSASYVFAGSPVAVER